MSVNCQHCVSIVYRVKIRWASITSAIWRGVIAAVDAEFRQSTDGYLSHVRHQITRHTGRVFSDVTGRVSSHRVEIAQTNGGPFLLSDVVRRTYSSIESKVHSKVIDE